MIERVTKLFIGKDIDTSSIAAAASMATIVAGIADGEVLVLNKDKTVAAATPTWVAGSKTEGLYICQGTGVTFDYTTEPGTAVTGVRKVIMSDLIDGAGVVEYSGKAFTVKVQQVSTFTAGFTPVLDTEYIVRLRYKDIPEHPARFSQTYRFIAEDAVLANVIIGLAAAINKDGGRRVNATVTGTTLVLTARSIPECTSSLNDIDEFSLVEFDAYWNYVNAAGNWAASGATLATVKADYGSGNWEQIRDLEKSQFASKGITNKTMFPVVTPEFSTAKGGYYDLITIVHNQKYIAPNNQGIEQARVTTKLAFATAVGGTTVNTQANLIETLLNAWMVSLPGAFANLAIIEAGT